MNIKFVKATGSDIKPFVNALGRLRIDVFSDWPYLYDGDINYEKKYLNTYIQSEKSFIFMVFDGNDLVGATTAIALTDETAEFQKPFLDKKISPKDVVYFGESILLKKYRGLGFGKKFMEERLNFAKSLSGIKQVSFCSVQRDLDDTRKPEDAKPLDAFWISMGFRPEENMFAEYEWKDIGDNQSTIKKLKFWSKKI